jgi:hypothetical protein
LNSLENFEGHNLEITREFSYGFDGECAQRKPTPELDKESTRII